MPIIEVFFLGTLWIINSADMYPNISLTPTISWLISLPYPASSKLKDVQ